MSGAPTDPDDDEKPKGFPIEKELRRSPNRRKTTKKSTARKSVRKQKKGKRR
jgi:hypothetical protein